MPEPLETVYDHLLSQADEDADPVEPTPVEIDQIQQDPRKVTLYCECGLDAVYTFKAAKRLLGLCSSSACMKKALPRLEEWAKVAQSKSFEILENDDPEPPKPKPTAREEIRKFQREHGLSETGLLDLEVAKALRQAGRGGMITIWLDRLAEETNGSV
jgi:hypothetical protein